MASPGRTRRVLIVVQNLPVPFDRRVWLEATTLVGAGYRVTVICPKAKGFNRSYEVIEGVRIHRFPVPLDARGAAGFVVEAAWCFVRTAMKILRVVLAGGYDVLHVCNPPETYWPFAHVGRIFGKKFLFDHHDLSPEMYLAKFEHPSRLAHRLLLWLERRTFRAADLVIAVNESHRRVAIERGGVPPDNLFVVRSGPDLARLAVHRPDPAWRKGKKHQLVYLGEICKQDGVDHLIRALRILRDELGRDDVHCVVVGGGPHQPEIRSYAAESGVSDMCTFTGRVSDDDLCRILSSSDLAVDPDPRNSWSDQSTMNKVVEYMHFGLPVVGYALTENMVSAGEAGVFAEPNCERALARCINTLLDDPARRREMAGVGRERVRASLAWEHSVPPLLTAYDSLFTAPGTPLRSRPRTRRAQRTTSGTDRACGPRGDRTAAARHGQPSADPVEAGDRRRQG
jgi:glycosyltransferase involved in cell wall biosynthesis